MTNPKQISIFIMIGVALFMIWYFFMREEKETVSVTVKGLGKAGDKAKAQANDPRQQSLDFQKSVARPDSKKGYLDLIVKSYDRERSELERYKRDGDPIHTRNAQDWHKFSNQVVSAYKTNRATLRGQNRPFILY